MSVSENDELKIQLTTEQEEYFRNSAIRDENGNLLICYHATHSKLFDELDFRHLDSASGSGYGPYFYTSPDLNYAESRTPGRHATDEECVAVFMNVTKPLDSHAINQISDAQLLEIVCKVDPKAKLGKSLKDSIRKKENSPYDPKYKEYKPPQKIRFTLNLERWRRNKQERAIYDVLSNILDNTDCYKLTRLYEELRKANPDLNAVTWNRAVTQVTRFDGLVVGRSEVAAFFPEQIKAVTNLTPQRDNHMFGSAKVESVVDLRERLASEKADDMQRKASLDAELDARAYPATLMHERNGMVR